MTVPERYRDYVTEVLAVLAGAWVALALYLLVGAHCLGVLVHSSGCGADILIWHVPYLALAVLLAAWGRRRYRRRGRVFSHRAIKGLALTLTAGVALLWLALIPILLGPGSIAPYAIPDHDYDTAAWVSTVCTELVNEVNRSYCSVRQNATIETGSDGCVTKAGPITATDGLGVDDPTAPTGTELGCHWVKGDDWTTVNTSEGSGEMRDAAAIAIVEGTAYDCIRDGYVDQDETCPIE